MKLINLKLNLSKIDKEKLFKGEKGIYLNLMVSLKSETDQYGNNASVWQEQTKEERESKSEKNYIGNGKTIWSNSKEVKESKQIDGLDF